MYGKKKAKGKMLKGSQKKLPMSLQKKIMKAKKKKIIMAKRGLYANINARKRKGISRPKSKSTISKKAYANMKAGFPKKKK
jgi:hypothetical protein